MDNRSHNQAPPRTMSSDEIDAILAAFLDALEGSPNTGRVHILWSKRYPALAPDFAFLAAERSTPYVTASVDPATSAAVQAMATRLLAVGPVTRESEGGAPAASLAALAQAGGWTLAALAAKLRVPALLIERLSERRVDVASIPVRFVHHLSETLGGASNDIVSLISPPGRLSTSAAIAEAPAPYNAAPRFDDLLTEGSDFDRDYWTELLRWSRRLGDVD